MLAVKVEDVVLLKFKPFLSPELLKCQDALHRTTKWRRKKKCSVQGLDKLTCTRMAACLSCMMLLIFEIHVSGIRSQPGRCSYFVHCSFLGCSFTCFGAFSLSSMRFKRLDETSQEDLHKIGKKEHTEHRIAERRGRSVQAPKSQREQNEEVQTSLTDKLNGHLNEVHQQRKDDLRSSESSHMLQPAALKALGQKCLRSVMAAGYCMQWLCVCPLPISFKSQEKRQPCDCLTWQLPTSHAAAGLGHAKVAGWDLPTWWWTETLVPFLAFCICTPLWLRSCR